MFRTRSSGLVFSLRLVVLVTITVLAIPTWVNHGGAATLWLLVEFWVPIVVLFGAAPRARVLTWILAVTLALFLLAMPIYSTESRQTWSASYVAPLSQLVRSALGRAQVVKSGATRTWRTVYPVSGARLILEADQPSETAATRAWWRPSSPLITEEPVADGSGIATKIEFPSAKRTYVMLTYDNQARIAGERFSFDVDLKALGEVPFAPCRGIWLQAWGKQESHTCLGVALNDRWHHFHVEWVAPPGTQTRYLRIVLNHFDGRTIFARNPKLMVHRPSGWRMAGPLIGTGPLLHVWWSKSEEGSRWFDVSLGASRKAFRFPLEIGDVPPGTVITAEFEMPSTDSVNVYQTSITPRDSFVSLRQHRRTSLWMTQPNLLGHTVATVGVALLAMTSGVAPLLLVVGSTLLVILAAGSRTALLAFVVGAIWLIVQSLGSPRRRFRMGLLAVLALLVAALAGLALLGDTRTSDVGRPAIWTTAIGLASRKPIFGYGEVPILNVPVATASERAVVTHAHNLWLNWQLRFGVFGLFAAVWFAASLLIASYKYGGPRAVAMAATLLVLQATDYSLLYFGVIAPAMATLVAIAEVEGVDARASS